MAKLFRELKARKAKYGFERYLHEENFIAISRAVQTAKAYDKELIFIISANMGSSTKVNLYTNDAVLAEHLRMVEE